jgi:hypothetical protein
LLDQILHVPKALTGWRCDIAADIAFVQVIVAVSLLGDKQAFSARFTTKLKASTWIG